MRPFATARLLGLSLLLAVGGTAAAQTVPGGNIPLDYFRPAIDSRGYLTVNASQPLGDKELSFGLGALDWGHHLLAFGDTSQGSFFGSKCGTNASCYSIDNIVTAMLIAAFGIHAGPSEIDLDVASFFKAVALEALTEGRDVDAGLRIAVGIAHEKSDAPHSGGRLR